LHVAKSDDAAAEVDFLKGLEQPNLAKDQEQSYAREYVNVAFRLGNAMKAYDAADNKKTAFDQLAWLFLDKKDADGLAQLIDAHRKAMADDGDVPLWDGEIRFLQKDHSAAADILKTNRQGILKNKQNAWRFKEVLVRSLAREKHVDEALAELKPAEDPNPDYLLTAVVHALAGDPTRTETALAVATEKGHLKTWSFYNDPDLGPILRTEPFKKIAEKYPEPKLNPKD
jgi:hypothetical protein